MSDPLLIVAFLAVLIALLAAGVWVGIALIIGACVAMVLFSDIPFWDSFALDTWSMSTSWSLTALPLFIWMGEILSRTRIADNLFQGLTPWCRRLPGGLLHVNVAGSALFSTITGSSAATVATVGRITIPELEKRGYDERRVLGTLAGAGTLGLLIPPSITLIIYGITANVSVADLFMAGVVPGLVLALLFMTYVALTSRHDGTAAVVSAGRVSKARGLLLLMPVLALMVIVIGSIYLGLATPTEAAAVGVVGALIMAAGQRCLNAKLLIESSLNAVAVTAMIALILMGSSLITLAMEYTGIPATLAGVVTDWQLSTPVLILVLTLFYILLGCFLDGISSITLTMAIIQPILMHYGIDLIWYGVFIILVVEMAQITPPIGINLFVLKGMTSRPIGYIATAALPMFLIMILMVVIIYLFPELATALPSLMRN